MNLKYQRRFKAEVSNGIGNWLRCLEDLTHVSIVINCAMIYFTSHAYKDIFLKQAGINGHDMGKALGFFLVVVLVEHAVLFLKVVIENIIEDVPGAVLRGQ